MGFYTGAGQCGTMKHFLYLLKPIRAMPQVDEEATRDKLGQQQAGSRTITWMPDHQSMRSVDEEYAEQKDDGPRAALERWHLHPCDVPPPTD